MLILEIALGLILGAVILANLDSILGVVVGLFVLAIVAALLAGVGSWLLDHPYDTALLGLIIFFVIAFVYWKKWLEWGCQRVLAFIQSSRELFKKIESHGVRKVFFSTTAERVKSRRKEMGYDE